MLKTLAFLLLSPAFSYWGVPDYPDASTNVAILDSDNSPHCGAVLLEQRRVVTAAHCVPPVSTVVVRCGGERILASVTKRHEDEDLALLTLPSSCAAPAARLARTDAPVGTPIFTMGYPNRTLAVGLGYVYRFELTSLPTKNGRQYRNHLFIASTAPGAPGSSGGGMFNEATGELLGVCSMIDGNLMLFSPASRIRRFLAEAAQ